MPQPPAYTIWNITCPSPEEAQASQQWLAGRIALDRVMTDTVRVTPNGMEQVETVQHRLGDYFADIRILVESPLNPALFRLVFHGRSDAGRFWKDLMVNVLQEIETAPHKAIVELDSKGETQPVWHSPVRQMSPVCSCLGQNEEVATARRRAGLSIHLVVRFRARISPHLANPATNPKLINTGCRSNPLSLPAGLNKMGTFFEVNPSGRFSEILEKAESGLDKLPAFDERLRKIEDALAEIRDHLFNQRTAKEHYTVEEVAAILGKSRFTVREWCRHGRILAEKGQAGRGADKEWRISHKELLRYQNAGLLPLHR